MVYFGTLQVFKTLVGILAELEDFMPPWDDSEFNAANESLEHYSRLIANRDGILRKIHNSEDFRTIRELRLHLNAINSEIRKNFPGYGG